MNGESVDERLRSRRDPLDEPRLRSLCADRRHVGKIVRVLRETTSTNDECHRAAEEGQPLGLVVFAEEQTAGRGQHGRHWHAPPSSGLLFSILLERNTRDIESYVLVAWSALSVCETLADAFSLDARIRWPNDVLVGDRKIAGILVERRQETVVGVGMNVNLAEEEMPPGFRMPATSLQMEMDRIFDRTALASALLERLDENFIGFHVHGDTEGMLDRWSRRSLLQPGDAVEITTRRTTVAGVLQSLSPQTGARTIGPTGIVAHVPSSDIVLIERR